MTKLMKALILSSGVALMALPWYPDNVGDFRILVNLLAVELGVFMCVMILLPQDTPKKRSINREQKAIY